MKIYLANQSKQTIGGGWTFLRNFKKGVDNSKTLYSIVDNWGDCEIYFISGATMVDKEEVEMAKHEGKKIVLRVDNIPRNSRNRNTGTSRLFKYAQMADLIVYQSKWARKYIKPFLKKGGVVILNGVDTEIFNTSDAGHQPYGSPQYLYVRYNRDETKRWEKAWYDFQLIFQRNKKANLWIVGAFSPEQIEYNFDFYRGEHYNYWGVVENPREMANIYRGADILLCPYYNDACSNVVAEALACGLKIRYDAQGGGGIPEQIRTGVISIEEMTRQYLDAFDKFLKMSNERGTVARIGKR